MAGSTRVQKWTMKMAQQCCAPANDKPVDEGYLWLGRWNKATFRWTVDGDSAVADCWNDIRNTATILQAACRRRRPTLIWRQTRLLHNYLPLQTFPLNHHCHYCYHYYFHFFIPATTHYINQCFNYLLNKPICPELLNFRQNWPRENVWWLLGHVQWWAQTFYF